MAYGVDFVEM
jgi:hypothetical protein